ncbi:hypothetical protein PFISCL1PPCAC_29089 [Pristionchus fissidentatus]|uniref:Uncharacterized protein n=1 Tax=Pristionchus fissidentatus TaxID=1538716 RepID=A0AAV5WZZ0_9BILA|nr:hypothetical protein PFISCL1PPCAC_29089 [Pristionchus fissidentatus]
MVYEISHNLPSQSLKDSTPIDGPTTSDSVPRPSILPMEDTVNGTEKMTRRRSEVEKRVRRRKRPDATASETLRESISSASSLTSLALSPDPANCTVSYDEDGARVVEVSLKRLSLQRPIGSEWISICYRSDSKEETRGKEGFSSSFFGWN